MNNSMKKEECTKAYKRVISCTDLWWTSDLDRRNFGGVAHYQTGIRQSILYAVAFPYTHSFSTHGLKYHQIMLSWPNTVSLFRPNCHHYLAWVVDSSRVAFPRTCSENRMHLGLLSIIPISRGPECCMELVS